jgi:hypothetical protein
MCISLMGACHAFVGKCATLHEAAATFSNDVETP